MYLSWLLLLVATEQRLVLSPGLGALLELATPFPPLRLARTGALVPAEVLALNTFRLLGCLLALLITLLSLLLACPLLRLLPLDAPLLREFLILETPSLLLLTLQGPNISK